MTKDQIEKLDTDLSPNLWYTSKRFWGMAAAVVQGLAMMFFGLELTPEELGQITTVGLGAGTAIAGAVGLWGSVRARGPLVFRKKTMQAITEKVAATKTGTGT